MKSAALVPVSLCMLLYIISVDCVRMEGTTYHRRVDSLRHQFATPPDRAPRARSKPPRGGELGEGGAAAGVFGWRTFTATPLSCCKLGERVARHGVSCTLADDTEGEAKVGNMIPGSWRGKVGGQGGGRRRYRGKVLGRLAGKCSVWYGGMFSKCCRYRESGERARDQCRHVHDYTQRKRCISRVRYGMRARGRTSRGLRAAH